MKKHVGLVGNMCGAIKENSIGIENSTIRGIIGIGANDQYTFSDSINASTWTDIAVSTGQCMSMLGECQCPPSVVSELNSTFLASMAEYDITQFAITWDGTLGKNSGKMLWNKDAEKDIPDNVPKTPIERDASKSMKLWSTNVTRMEVDGVDMNLTTRQYFFDTGSGFISLPSEVFGSVKNGSTVTFTLPTIDSEYSETSSFDITVTQELIDARVFRIATETAHHFFGLNIFRYLDNILINFNQTDPYFRANVRENPILELPADLPVGELAGSKSNETKQLNLTNSSSSDSNMDNTDIVSTTIMNSAATVMCSSKALSMFAVVVTTLSTTVLM